MDQVKGRIREVKGTIKEAAGRLVGNGSLESKGRIEKVMGEVHAKLGDARKNMKDAFRR